MQNFVEWATEEQNSLLYVFRGTWNWDEVEDTVIEGDLLMNEVMHPVNIILDIQNAGNLLGPGFLVHARRIFGVAHPNCSGRIVLIQADPTIHSVHTLLNRAFSPIFSQIDVYYADSYEEAARLLSHRNGHPNTY
ncbi:hypothetical protein G4Y79_23500 [Phototrophicus methaneseepsis]|uniref:STAS/SEC14 domain-containing protein n=1 Tax=Phototrophicus methaneseepsis TaxID=2710758 RepID=A0A7S8IF68_9CHLR|nr:hypothetical protein [Phototrophicus methaneseepsis]QPC82618.1 hypothetical protein G4Y79_23500 [Phototrophicus methaneseepsis]